MSCSDISWIVFILQRFNAADTKGRSAITSIFSVLGIAFGVMVLIVILSVMNGFQRGMIDTILQVNSAHVRLSGSAKDIEKAKAHGRYASFYVFSENQTLLQSKQTKQQPALLRAVPKTILGDDTGFSRAITVTEGAFDLSEPFSIVLGHELARSLSVQAKGKLSVIALAGGNQTDIFPENITLSVKGIIKTGYYAIDASFAFISNETAALLYGTPETLNAAVKLHKPEADGIYITSLIEAVPSIRAESWRSYNHAFFGALRVEKNTMFMLVFLIFIVVTVNIYNGMRRSIYERREEISLLASFGATKRHIQALFITNGCTLGLFGASMGLLLGLLLSLNINEVFFIAETVINSSIELLNVLAAHITSKAFSIFSPQYFYIDSVPVRIFFEEVFIIFLFGVLSASCAAWIAARKILTLQPAEVLRYE